MDMLDYMEREARLLQDHVMEQYARSHERIYKLLGLFVAGAGALGVYVLDLLGKATPAITWAPLAAVSAWWFLIAVGLLLQGLQSNLLGVGAVPTVLWQAYTSKGGHFSPTPSATDEIAAIETRLSELMTQNKRIDGYNKAIDRRSRVTNWAYRAAAATPAPPALVLAALGWCSY